jgi:hypothetical protein
MKHTRLWYLNKVKRRAKRDNIEFDIDLEYIDKLFEDQKGLCALSHIKLIPSAQYSDRKGRGVVTASLDRIDSSKGYTRGNLQWVHKAINEMKLNKTDGEFVEWCRLITNVARKLMKQERDAKSGGLRLGTGEI